MPDPGGWLVLGVGSDLVDIDRMRQVLGRTPGFARRVFTDAERATAEARRDPAKPLAARFAAKEATLKSLGLGLGAMAMTQIEVVRAPSGAPSVVLHGAAADVAAEAGVARFLVSLTHTDHVAHAIVLACTPPSPNR